MNIFSNWKETTQYYTMKSPPLLAATQHDIIPDTLLVTTLSTHTHTHTRD